MPKYWPAPSSCIMYLEGQQDGNGTTIKDISGNGNHCTFKGAGEPAWSIDGRGLRVLTFDGANDFLTNATFWDTAPTYVTISFWFSPTANIVAGGATLWYLFEKVNVINEDRIKVYINEPDGKIYLGTEYNNEGAKFTSTAATSWVGGAWYHYLCRYNGTDWRVYINGVEEADVDAANGFMLNGTAQNFMIGSDSAGTNNFAGRIALFEVSNIPFTASQANGNYSRERTLLGF